MLFGGSLLLKVFPDFLFLLLGEARGLGWVERGFKPGDNFAVHRTPICLGRIGNAVPHTLRHSYEETVLIAWLTHACIDATKWASVNNAQMELVPY